MSELIILNQADINGKAHKVIKDTKCTKNKQKLEVSLSPFEINSDAIIRNMTFFEEN